VEKGVRRMSLKEHTEQLAWVVLSAADRTQSRGSPDRLVVPRAPEVTDEIGMQLTDVQFSSVEEYLEEQGYITVGELGLRWGAYTAYSVTPAGLVWLDFEEERRRIEEVRRELAEESPGGPQSTGAGSGKEEAEEAPPVGEGAQNVTEQPRDPAEFPIHRGSLTRPWWRRVLQQMSLETRQLAWLVLETVNRMQGKGSTVRLVAPCDQEVARQLDPFFAEHELLSAEEYLLERGHIAQANLGLRCATYTITTTGLDWLDEGFPRPSEALQSAAERPQRAEPRSTIPGPQESAESRPWWRRVLGA
jgi:hypothetical protein